jgi:hypothetical protein
MNETPKPASDEDDAGEHNEIGYRNVDEEAEHDESGSQGPGDAAARSDESSDD